jgi:hypothetical protein
MSEIVQQLTSQQVNDLRRQFDERAAKGLGTVLRGLPAPPLPRCPACAAEAERVDQRVEDPKFEFGADEREVRMRWLPCGHRFRAVIELLDVGLVRPGEEPTT